MSVRWRLAIVAAALAGATVAVFVFKHRAITLQGAVILQDADARKQSPIAGVVVTALDNAAIGSATSDFSGFFRMTLQRTVLSDQVVTLHFRHPDYQPLDLEVPVSDELSIAHLLPVHVDERPRPDQPAAVLLSNLVVRYSVEIRSSTNVGSEARAFEVVNTGNVPCAHPPCSPDRKWQARIGGVSLDAGADNQFRDARLSCIAGPCPFTRVESDGYSRGGQSISATVRDWSETTTFVLEAEVFRPLITNTVQRAYPTILGRTLHFTLPASAEGPSIEAELNGHEIVFPFGPDASLSWATCEVRTEKDQTKVYRCELKTGYAFKDRDGE